MRTLKFLALLVMMVAAVSAQSITIQPPDWNYSGDGLTAHVLLSGGCLLGIPGCVNAAPFLWVIVETDLATTVEVDYVDADGKAGSVTQPMNGMVEIFPLPLGATYVSTTISVASIP
jgi:hypothetical protein